ncbi:hypothetical protein Bca52824_051784 [Brassica carinata]|uniref:Uncharacterized protein n=1 Tax=Brassica carinata TaxID=52824 RepID=A0A8X7R145_BRACI|nr:hypothetical protein Bca52824_051784 [Brassica carinata]
MTDPYYKEMKHHKREYDWVSNCVYANYKIPTKCICGGAITVEADDRRRNYYVCKDFKNDGLHIRHDCLTALEEELDCLRSQYAEESLNDRAAVDPVGQGGLKEEIRDGLETEEFATLEALFEEAEEVEEGLKETSPSSPRKRRRTSPDHRSSKRARKAERKGDPRMRVMDTRRRDGLKDDEEGDYREWMQMERWMTTPNRPTTHWVLGSSGWTTTQTAPTLTPAPPTPTRNLLLF